MWLSSYSWDSLPVDCARQWGFGPRVTELRFVNVWPVNPPTRTANRPDVATVAAACDPGVRPPRHARSRPPSQRHAEGLFYVDERP